MTDEPAPHPKSERITPQDVIREIPSASGSLSEASQAERSYIKRFGRFSVSAQVSYEHLKGIRDHYSHKIKWSYLLMGTICGMVIFQSVLLWKVGKGQLDFTAYEWLLPALLVQNLGQVVGLAVYAVRYLFSDISGQKVE